MKSRGVKDRLLVFGAVMMLVLAGVAIAGEQVPDEGRLSQLRQAGVGASLTVFPFVLGEQPMAQVGGVVGVMMEQAGLEDVEVDEAVFRPESGAGIDQAAEAFGSFVREHGISSQYALYGEFLGSQSVGITEIRAFLVDREGNAVWVDGQAPGDADFDNAAPGNPMECCVFVAERLKGVMALPDIGPGMERKAGKLEREMASRAGIPEESEFEAMKKRKELFSGRTADADIEIYPVLLGGEVSKVEADRLSGMLEKKGFGRTSVSGTELVIEVEPGRNEQKMLWSMARKFREHLRANPPDADYVVYADYLMRVPDGPVGAVHIVVCDRDGEWVAVDMQNSHHKYFRKIKPKDADGCSRLAAKMMERYTK